MKAVQELNLMARLLGEHETVLFQDGAVKLDASGNMHQFADWVVQNSDSKITFANANMLTGQPDSLNVQLTALQFNQSLPASYTDATRTAFRSDGPTMPAYWATDVSNSRSNLVDILEVQANGGKPVFQDTMNRYVTVFTKETAKVTTPDTTTTLYARTPDQVQYLGGQAPVVDIVHNGGANTTIRNTYTNGVVLERNVTFLDDLGNAASASSLPGDQTARDYLFNNLSVQDTVTCSLFSKGAMTTFGSVKSRLLSGLDAVVTNADAQGVLSGDVLEGAPDGFFHSLAPQPTGQPATPAAPGTDAGVTSSLHR